MLCLDQSDAYAKGYGQRYDHLETNATARSDTDEYMENIISNRRIKKH